uniref:Athp-2 n=1 Tax=Pristionchus pacificus TaxID=54126 RepID=A0A2A6B3P8_PRIPA|eukprot:PDM60481.1 athp-2 [Pristionchus pacificus]
MPLYNKKPLSRIHPPINLQPTDKVYYLEASGEIFTTYDEFFNRTILLNSTDFSCALTGKTGLTYFEALESENEAKEELKNFPDYLQAPILYLVQYLTCRGRLDDVLSDVTVFMKDRYFIGEELLWHDGKQKRAARIQGIRTKCDFLSNLTQFLNSASTIRTLRSEWVQDRQEKEPQLTWEFRLPRRIVMKSSRSRAHMSKQKLKLFLKNSCVLIDKRQEVKESFCRDFRLDQHSWMQYFADPAPVFPLTPLLFRGRPTKGPIKLETEPKEKGQRGRKRKEGGSEKNGENPPKKVRDASLPQPNNHRLERLVKRRGSRLAHNYSDFKIEAQQAELEVQFDVAKRLGIEGLDRFQQNEKVLSTDDIEELKELIKQGRIKEREEVKARKEREKREKAEWRKPRDDLACDDLQPLPSYARLPLPDWMSAEDFSSYLNLYQFFLSFQEILPIKETRGTSRISFADVVIAVRCRDPANSSLADLIAILWGARRELAEEEDGDEAAVSRLDACEEMDNERWAEQIRSRNETHDQMRQAFGASVRNLQVDWMTMSEAVRLHLLTAGYYTGVQTSRFRVSHRGGLRCYEDPAYSFCEQYPDVMEQLETMTIFDLMPSHRLAILQVFVDQLLSYQKFRAHHEERTTELHETRKQLKLLRSWGVSQEKEAKEAALLVDVEGQERPKPSAETKRLRSHLKAIKENRRFDKSDLEEIVLAGIAYNELDADEIVQAKEVQKEFYEKGEDELMERIFQIEGLSSLVFLGRDRAYRSYFFLDALPALIVEEPSEWDRERVGSCDEPTPLNEDVVASYNGNIHSARLAVTGCTGDGYCPSHGSEAKDRQRWQMVDTVEKMEQLMTSLNPRGFRESELLEEITENERKLMEMVERSARKLESGSLAAALMADSPDPFDSECTIDFEKEMRELIVDLEEKIYLGQIGCLPKGIDRTEWKKRLLESGDVTGLIQGDVAIRVEGALKEEEEAGDEEQEILYFQDDFLTLSNSEKLAFALLQLFQSVDFRCFKEPFITNDRQRGADRNISEVFLVWQRTLSQNAKSVPMIAMFLYTLDSKIAWDRSRYQGKCRVCRRKGEAEQLVLCADCCVTYHLTCVRPILEVAVTGWLCAECKALRRREAAKEKRLAAREAAQRAEQEMKDEEDEEGGFAGRSSTDRTTKSASGSEEREKMAEPMKTSSGRIVKKVLYNENYNGAVIMTKGKKPVKDEQQWTDYDSADSEAMEDEDSPKRGERNKKKRREYDPHQDAVRVSIGLRETTGSFKDSLHECTLAIKDTMGQYFAWPFLAPVDKKEVPDYYDVIKNPMDLQTMVTKIKNNTYDALEEVQEDLDQMITNCKVYNEDGSEIIECALRTSEYLQPKLESIIRKSQR